MPLPPRAALEDVAVRAGRVGLRHFYRVAAERKPDQTLVTQADREVEAFLTAELGALCPEAGIIGEEGTTRRGNAPYVFVLDPIDGTSAFVAGLPTWCVCLGVVADGRPLAGVVYLPCADEVYSAMDGAAWWRGSPLSSLPLTPRVGEGAMLMHAKMHRRHRLTYVGEAHAFGSAAYHIVLVARGVAQAALLGRSYVWDLAAAGAVLTAVGGTFEYLSGKSVELSALMGGERMTEEALAGTPAAIAQVRTALLPVA